MTGGIAALLQDMLRLKLLLQSQLLLPNEFALADPGELLACPRVSYFLVSYFRVSQLFLESVNSLSPTLASCWHARESVDLTR